MVNRGSEMACRVVGHSCICSVASRTAGSHSWPNFTIDGLGARLFPDVQFRPIAGLIARRPQ
jgi:hypothetical protein